MPHPLTTGQIEDLIFAFAHGVRRIKEAGLDAAEIHGAHGYLVHEVSPHTSTTAPTSGVAAGKTACGLSWRSSPKRASSSARTSRSGSRVGLDGDGHHNGLSIDELAEIGALLSDHVAYISVSSGSYSGFGDGFETAYVSPWYKELGFNVPMAAAMKRKVTCPVIVTGRIADLRLQKGFSPTAPPT